MSILYGLVKVGRDMTKELVVNPMLDKMKEERKIEKKMQRRSDKIISKRVEMEQLEREAKMEDKWMEIW